MVHEKHEESSEVSSKEELDESIEKNDELKQEKSSEDEYEKLEDVDEKTWILVVKINCLCKGGKNSPLEVLKMCS